MSWSREDIIAEIEANPGLTYAFKDVNIKDLTWHDLKFKLMNARHHFGGGYAHETPPPKEHWAEEEKYNARVKELVDQGYEWDLAYRQANKERKEGE